MSEDSLLFLYQICYANATLLLMASRIVVVGRVDGKFIEVFKKISTLHAKNAFSLAIVAGDLFADPSKSSPADETNIETLLAGNVEIPLPVYFALGKQPLPPKVIQKLESTGGEVCENLFFLGKRTTIKTSEGIRLVSLGGQLDSNLVVGMSKDKYTPFYSGGDASALKGANTADILLTSEWPFGIRAGSKVMVEFGIEDPASHHVLAELCTAVKPRYHFSTSAAFYEREPFFHTPTENNNPDGYAITRFISLASFGNTTKQKWIYAFTLDTSASNPHVIPAGTTASPFAFGNKKRQAPSNGEFSRFSTNDRHHGRPNKRSRLPPPGPGECFFCLSNPNLATHLITSIGTDAYLTTAKGPLSTSTAFPNLGFPSHVLIIPLPHTPTLGSIPDVATREETVKEMQRYRGALNGMVKEMSAGQLGSVTWEVSRSSGIHTHWQYLPMPVDLIQRGLVEAAFKVEAENEQYPTFEVVRVSCGTEQDTSDYFKAWIWKPSKGSNSSKVENMTSEKDSVVDDGAETSLTLPLDSSFRFDLQFGRRVLAKLLGLENRVQWRDCGQTEAEEITDADGFKEAFKKFDFTLND